MSDVPPPLPAFTSWPTFPFEGELRVKQLDEPVDVEPPRQGDDPAECSACRAPDTAYIWVSERWRVRALERPTGLPMVLILESRSHLDLGDLPNLLAAELGVLTVRLERAIRSLDGVARVHVNRWGDGSAHLHVWFLARPYGRLQLRGTFLSLWDDILPRIPEAQWRDNLALVAAWLAEFGGRPLAAPAHIAWQSPARITIPGQQPAIDEDTVPVPTGEVATDDSGNARPVLLPDGGGVHDAAAASSAAVVGAHDGRRTAPGDNGPARAGTGHDAPSYGGADPGRGELGPAGRTTAGNGTAQPGTAQPGTAQPSTGAEKLRT